MLADDISERTWSRVLEGKVTQTDTDKDEAELFVSRIKYISRRARLD